MSRPCWPGCPPSILTAICPGWKADTLPPILRTSHARDPCENPQLMNRQKAT